MTESIKFRKWYELFTNPNSPTVGNSTQSALKVYKTKNYHSAGQIGYENLKKLETLGLELVEGEGLTVKEWYKIAAAKAVKGSYEQTINFMQRIGIMAKDGPAPTNQINQHFNFDNLADTFRAARMERGLPVD